MNDNLTAVAVERTEQSTIHVDAVLVPAHGTVVARWEDDLVARAQNAGLHINFERAQPDDPDTLLEAVALSRDGGSDDAGLVNHYGGEWVRIHIDRQFDFAGEGHMLFLPHPADVIACTARILDTAVPANARNRTDDTLIALSSPHQRLTKLRDLAQARCAADTQRITGNLPDLDADRAAERS